LDGIDDGCVDFTILFKLPILKTPEQAISMAAILDDLRTRCAAIYDRLTGAVPTTA
jgi:hypothetical protein